MGGSALMSVTAPGAATTSGSVPTSPTRTEDVPGARRQPPFGGLEERGGRRKDASVAVRVVSTRPKGVVEALIGTQPAPASRTTPLQSVEGFAWL